MADRRAALDALAADFTTMVNSWSAAGVDSNGNPGTALIGAPAGAVSMQPLASDPALVPAADASGVSNGNLLATAYGDAQLNSLDQNVFIHGKASFYIAAGSGAVTKPCTPSSTNSSTPPASVVVSTGRAAASAWTVVKP